MAAVASPGATGTGWRNSPDTMGKTDADHERIIDAAGFEDGDCELISADNVRFRVHFHSLLAASQVFRDIHSLQPRGPDAEPLRVSFTDPDIETARVLALFLTLISTGILRNTDPDADFADLRELALFLHKWGCTQSRQHVIYALESAALQRAGGTRGPGQAQAARPRPNFGNGMGSPPGLPFSLASPAPTLGGGTTLRLFVVAAALQAPALCVLIVRSRAHETWPSPITSYPRHRETGVPGRSVWCPAGWPEWFWAAGLPYTYMFALARAGGMDGEIAVNFERCLRGLVPKGW